MFEIKIDVKAKGNASKAVQTIAAIMADKRGLLTVIGRRAAEELRKHFAKLEKKYPNKMGGKRTHFWTAVMYSVQQPIIYGKEQVQVGVDHPVFAHKVGIGPAGGWIRPVEKKWLAIPVIAEAYGKSPLEYSEGGGANKELRFFKKNEQTAFLANVEITKVHDFARYDLDDDAGYMENRGQKKTKEKIKLHIVFVLKKKVFQKPMPDALPSQTLWKSAMTETAQDYLELQIAKGLQLDAPPQMPPGK